MIDHIKLHVADAARSQVPARGNNVEAVHHTLAA